MAKGVLKEVAKLNKIPHPKSRKTAQLTKKAIRSTHREKSKNANFMKQNLLGEKFLWFKERIQSVDEVNPAKVLELIQSYLGRFDEELEQIQIKHSVGQRKGRQHASREDSIKSTQKHEMDEFNTYGIEMPQLLNKKQLSMLMNWNGELRFLQNFKVVRYSRSNLEGMVRKGKGGQQKVPGKADEEEKKEECEEKDKEKEECEEKDKEKEECEEKDKEKEKNDEKISKDVEMEII